MDIGEALALLPSLGFKRTLSAPITSVAGDQVEGTGMPGAAVYLYVDGVEQADHPTVAGDGTWTGTLDAAANGVIVQAAQQYAPISSKVSFPVARKPGVNTAYALGDSRTLDNLRATTYTNVGGTAWARSLLKGQLAFDLTDNNGVGGATTRDIRANQYPAAKASGKKTLILLAGVNDCFQSVTTEESLANLQYMIDDWIGQGSDYCVVVADEKPWDRDAYSGKEDQLIAIRDYVRSRENDVQGVYRWPTWLATTATQDQWTPLADTYRDGLHDAIPGAYRDGLALKGVLEGLLPPNTFFDRSITIGGDYVGTGTAPTNPDGAWTAPSGAGYTTSMEVIDGLNWLRIDFVNILGQFNVYPSSATIPAGYTAGVTNVRSSIRYRIPPGSSNIRCCRVEMRRQGGQSLKLVSNAGVNAADLTDMGSPYDSQTRAIPADADIDGVLYAPTGVFAADSTQLRPWFMIVHSRTSLPMSGTLRLALPQSEAV